MKIKMGKDEFTDDSKMITIEPPSVSSPNVSSPNVSTPQHNTIDGGKAIERLLASVGISVREGGTA